MLGQNLFVWNVRGLNMRARRSVMREFLVQEHASVLCRVETKLDVLSLTLANELMGTGFDYFCLPSLGASGGIVVAWRRDVWATSNHIRRQHSTSISIASVDTPSSQWSLAVVYGPFDEHLKLGFLDELRAMRTAMPRATSAATSTSSTRRATKVMTI